MAPVNVPAEHFGLGERPDAPTPDDCNLIESSNRKVQGLDQGRLEYL